jgi:hypothetical protein
MQREPDDAAKTVYEGILEEAVRLALPGHFVSDVRLEATSAMRASDGLSEVGEQPMEDGLT